MRRLAIAIAAVVFGGACGDDAPASAESIMQVWKQEGLDPGGFADADGSKFGGGKCRAGSVAGLEATLCEYADAKAAKGAELAGQVAIGETTGVSLARGKLLLVLADRRSADPNGKKMNQAAKTFLKRAGP